VNIVTKSGTNKIHGNVFEFIRNGAVNARNFFATTVDPLKRNQFGGNIGAPILHDRWFVFAGYQGTRLSDIAGGNVAFVPTALQRTGNLSNVTTPITNPATGKPFPSNSSIGPLDPVIQKLLAYIPLPSNPATGGVTYSLPKVNTEDSVVAKTDFVLGAHRFFGRYFYDTFNWPGTGIPNNNLLSTFRGQQHQWNNATVGDTWARGNFVSDARFSFIRDNSVNVAGESTVTLPGLGAGFTVGQFPTIQLVQTVGLFNIAAGNYNGFSRNTYDGAEDITILHGRHQISFGAEVQFIRSNIKTDNTQNAIPVFTGAATGNVTADLLLGISDVTLQADGALIQAAGTLPGFYGEDKIRLNDRLTVVAGLRWDPYWPFHALNGNITCYIPGEQSKVFTNAPSGLVFPGDPNCNSSGTNSNNLGNVQPRLGFALKADSSGETLLRGGYGIYTMQFPMANFLAFGAVQPFIRNFRISTPISVTNPWATFPGGNPFVNGFQLNSNPRPANSPFVNPGQAYSMTQNFRLAYVQQWSLILERSITDNDFVSIGYYGTAGRHLSLVQDNNQAVYIPGQSTTANVQSRRPNPNVAAVNTYVSSGMSSYNGLELVYRHRVRGGLTLMANVNWSKSLDDGSSPANVTLTGGSFISMPNHPSFRWGPSDFDQRHTWRAIGTWNLPWYSNSSGFKKVALAGWQLNGLFTWDSGFPFSVTSSLNQSFTSNGTDLADRVPGVPITLPNNRSEQAKIAQYFNTAAFTANAPGTFGNSSRNLLTSPDYVNVDTGIVKGFQIKESVGIILRFETFNVLNHTQFLPPIGALGATIGHLTGARDPRILQGAIKVSF
jgi:TonB dependent receptor